MKKRSFLLFCFITIVTFGQKNDFLDATFFYGIALEHDESLHTAIQGSPYGFMLSYSNHKIKNTKFNQHYNFPDKGFSFIYQNLNSTVLGESYGVYRHYTFFFGKNINKPAVWFLKAGFGLAYNTKPYNATINNQNFAIGSHAVISGFANFGYQNQYLWNRVGVKAGLTLIHYSNASIKNPNLGINTIGGLVGFNYNLDKKPVYPKRVKEKDAKEYKGKVKYAFVFRSGINQSQEIGSETYPFYHFTGYASKRINYGSSLTAGADYFISPFIKDYIPYYNTKYYKNEHASNTDRFGVFLGYELYFSSFSGIAQVGYYVYAPFVYESSVYERFGFKYQLSKHLISELTLKVNLFRAEALEFGIGYQF